MLSGHSNFYQGCWIVKTNSTGDTAWSNTFGDKHLPGGLCVQQTSDGGYIVTVGGRLVKTDAAGDSVWGNTPALFWSVIEWVEETSDGGYVVAGWVQEHYDPDDDRSKMTIAKLDSDGNKLWNHGYGGDLPHLQDGGTCVRETPDGGYIVSGWRDGSTSLWLVKFDSEGSIDWDYYNDVLEWGTCVQLTADGSYVVSCGNGLAKINAAGEDEWVKLYGEGYDASFYVVQASDGGYVVVGAKYPPGQSEWYKSDLWLYKTDALGEQVWSRIHGGNLMDAGYCVQVSGDGYVVIGVTASAGAGDSDYYLLKTDSEGSLLVEEEAIAQATPTWMTTSLGRQITLRYSDTPDGFCAVVYNASGRKVDEVHSASQSGTLTWGKRYVPGVYFIKVQNGGEHETRKVVLVK